LSPRFEGSRYGSTFFLAPKSKCRPGRMKAGARGVSTNCWWTV